MPLLFIKHPRTQEPRHLTISQDPDMPAGLRVSGKSRATGRYNGEVLNFQSAEELARCVTKRRLDLVQLAQAKGALPILELARLAGRELASVQEDVLALNELQLLEPAGTDAVLCPFEEVRLDADVAALVAGREQHSRTAPRAHPFPTPSPLENTP